MIRRRLAVVVVGLAALCMGAGPGAPDWTGTLDAGEESLAAAAWFDEERTRGFVRIGGSTSKVYRAWKIALGDLDDDGTDEVVLGIWSHQKRHDEPEPHRTVWVLRWDGERLVEAWRGSALARPLVAFALRDVDAEGPEELVAYERGKDGCWLTAYRWSGFGFAGHARAAVPCEGRLAESACLTAGSETKCPVVKQRTMEFR